MSNLVLDSFDHDTDSFADYLLPGQRASLVQQFRATSDELSPRKLDRKYTLSSDRGMIQRHTAVR